MLARPLVVLHGARCTRPLLRALLCLSLACPAFANPDSYTDAERNTIRVFNEASASVVYITSSEYRRNFHTFQVTESRRGAGTGIVWDKTGHILTNYHVVHRADKLLVNYGRSEALEAELVGTSPVYDIAVLKVEAKGKPLLPLKRGDSDRLEVGGKVLAIGNPFGFDTSLSVGVVSALGREINTGGGIIRNAIQTDAAINPGNSGGPLLNSAGELVGMNVLIYSPSGASAGIGFSIPVNTLKRIAPKLIEYGRVPRAFLGIEYRSDAWARQAGVAEGVPVVRVIPGTPARKARMRGMEIDRRGYRLGDIIVAIGGDPVNGTEDLQRLLENYRAGDVAEISARRDGELNEYEVKFTRD